MKNHKLIAARKAKKLTQEQVAEILKVANKSVVSNWENGNCKPRIDHAFQLSTLYGETVDYLFGDEMK